MFCRSIHAVYNFSEKFMPRGYKQCIITYTLYIGQKNLCPKAQTVYNNVCTVYHFGLLVLLVKEHPSPPPPKKKPSYSLPQLLVPL